MRAGLSLLVLCNCYTEMPQEENILKANGCRKKHKQFQIKNRYTENAQEPHLVPRYMVSAARHLGSRRALLEDPLPLI